MPDHSKYGSNEYSLKNCKGELFRAIFLKVYRIISVQFANPNVKGIKGFIFTGDTGIGKTYMARVLAHELSVPLLFVDSATVARKHYGESERQITKLFEEAMHNRCLLLFDDVESLFLDRSNEASEGWNLDQNNVMFHQLDTVDTSRCSVILTTNLIDFLDEALRDRLYSIQFPVPDLGTILEIAWQKCADLNINSEGVEKTIRSSPESFRSIRAVEKTVLDEYVMQLESRSLKQKESVKVSA